MLSMQRKHFDCKTSKASDISNSALAAFLRRVVRLQC